MAKSQIAGVEPEYKDGIIVFICLSIPMGISLFFIFNILQMILGILNLMMLFVMLVTMGKVKI